MYSQQKNQGVQSTAFLPLPHSSCQFSLYSNPSACLFLFMPFIMWDPAWTGLATRTLCSQDPFPTALSRIFVDEVDQPLAFLPSGGLVTIKTKVKSAPTVQGPCLTVFPHVSSVCTQITLDSLVHHLLSFCPYQPWSPIQASPPRVGLPHWANYCLLCCWLSSRKAEPLDDLAPRDIFLCFFENRLSHSLCTS